MPETEALKKRITALEEELKRAEDELRRAGKKIPGAETYASSVAHDLNNILAGIITYPDLILMELPDDSPLKKYVLSIKQSGEKAVTLVQDILLLTQSSVPVTHTIDLNDIISALRKTPDFKEIKADHPDVKVVFDLEMPLDNIKGVSTPITKSIMNILRNGVESISGQGRVTVSTANRSINSPEKGYGRVIEKGDYVTVSIEDTGKGLSKKDISKIFEPFYAKKVMGRSGSGLSMPVVWKTMNLLKGHINIQSTDDRGTTFTLYFPVTDEKDFKKSPQDEISNCMGNGESILVVDDMPEQRDMACTILKRLGYSVCSVSCGEDAIAYLTEKKADMVILDMIMDPGIDGLETYKRISKIRPDQRFIIVSGYAETERLTEIKRLGCPFCIKKPYSITEIGAAIKKGLSNSQYTA